MFELSRRLLYYKRKDIQEAMIFTAIDREVGIRFADKGYGKRPDILMYENDILEAVKSGATSFHFSEERWNNPLELNTGMRRPEQDALRKGWDLVLDIDCPFWKISKLTAHLFVLSLKMHNIKSISCKFSGNKGFHIGVPFEAFPKEINGEPTKNWFPDGPKKIALYLLDYISNNLISINGEKISFDKYEMTLGEISELTGKPKDELTHLSCTKCRRAAKTKDALPQFICARCQTTVNSDKPVVICERCKSIMQKIPADMNRCICGSSDFKDVFDPLSIIDLDTILISSRHMYRAPYSLHEKSGLASVPIMPDKILEFEKTLAEPENVKPDFLFLDSRGSDPSEGTALVMNAFDFMQKNLPEEPKKEIVFQDITENIPKELFPPCIINILKGMEDGKKRSLFILTNFFKSVNWQPEEISSQIIEWNSRNKEPIREGYIISHLRYHKDRKEKILPPNCRSYYKDLGMCTPDNFCERIKNPVQYAKKKARMLNPRKNGRAKLTEEQKEMRRRHREMLKNKNPGNKQDSNEDKA